MKSKLYIIIVLLAISCNGIEDVEPNSRSTFIKVLGSSLNSIGYKTIAVSDGYVTVSSALSDTSEYAIVTKTNFLGNTDWNQLFIDTNALDIIASDNGYLIVGDSINRQDNNENLTKLFLFEIDVNGNFIRGTTIGDLSIEPRDFHGVALARNTTDEIVVLGTLENEFDQEEMIVAGFNNAIEKQWEQIYGLSNENYHVGKNIHYDPSGRIIWVANSIAFNIEDNSEIEKSSISIPVILSNSENVNNNTYGDNIDGIYLANDIKPIAGGYGVIGRTNINDTNDIFYLKSNGIGDIDANSFTTFSSTLSGLEFSGSDEGVSLVNSSDGGTVLMCTINTTTQIGNGGTDIYLLKVDYNGNPLWESFIGGSGDESGTNIIQTSDGGFLITGTNNFQGSSVSLLIKTNSKGKLIE